MPLVRKTNKPATHSGNYDPISRIAPVPGLTVGKRYDLIHDDASYTCILINDHGSYFETDAQDFSQITALDDRPLTAQPVFDSQYANDPNDTNWDDEVFAPDPADYLAPGIQVIARDVVPEPEGPQSTESLRQYRYTPDTF